MSKLTIGTVLAEMRDTPAETERIRRESGQPDHPIFKMATDKDAQEFFLVVADYFEKAVGPEHMDTPISAKVYDSISNGAAELASCIGFIKAQLKVGG